MDNIDNLLRQNPKAAKGYAAVQETLAVLSELRAAGIAKGDQNSIIGRSGVGGVKPFRRGLPVKG